MIQFTAGHEFKEKWGENQKYASHLCKHEEDMKGRQLMLEISDMQ
jgi:hypothetical protein